MLENFKEIEVESPVDIIIRQIRSLITSGQLNPGDRLPSERQLAERFGVGRSYVREAIHKLEFYGILRILPQSGTVIAGLGLGALEGLISDVLKLEEANFHSLVETRILLEVEGAAKAAERRTEDDLVSLNTALLAYEKKVLAGEGQIEEDLLFHLKIAEASKNNVLKSLMLVITPDIITNFVQLEICDDARVKKSVIEHREIMQYIRDKDPAGAKIAMENHLGDLLNSQNTLIQS